MTWATLAWALTIFAAFFAGLQTKRTPEEPDSVVTVDLRPIDTPPELENGPVSDEGKGTVPSTVPGTVPAPTAPPPKGIDYGAWPELVKALIEVESDGIDTAIGDRHLTDMAYGCLQIRKPVCLDVNRVYGTNLKPQDMLGNRQLSIDTFYRYMAIYATQKRIGQTVTHEDRARIWNGGPSACFPASRLYTATNHYWSKVKRQMV